MTLAARRLPANAPGRFSLNDSSAFCAPFRKIAPCNFRPTGVALAVAMLWCLTPALPAWSWVPVCAGEIPIALAEKVRSEESPSQAQGTAAAPSAAQDPSQAKAQPSGGVGKGNTHERPHLIELSAQNWRPLKTSEKFELFWRDLIDPGVHFTLAVDAAISLATDGRDYLGEGISGYARRYGYNVADEATATFVQGFLLPAVFHEDPRYIPLEKGSRGRRTAYALSRIMVTRKDTGDFGFNKSKLLGTLITTAASNIYTPQGLNTSASATFTRTAISLGSDAAFNLFKEFWPDFARKIRLKKWIESIVRRAIRDAIRVD